ncbi:MAG: hypothetical protein IPH20_04945 [Bacteroidales bacterium]|nr:hypothetical protein [Bacteroidales bacterium]
MEERKASLTTETVVKPPDPVPVLPGLQQNILLLKAQCHEKEGNYEIARDLFIRLNHPEEALRCSEGLKKARKERDKLNSKSIYLLSGFAVFFIVAFIFFLILLNNRQRGTTVTPVEWLNKGNVELAGYPAWFLYDHHKKQIRTKVVIDDRMKMELENSFPVQRDSANFAEFRQAVDKLAFVSSDLEGRNYWLLLMVSGLAAIVGVFIREILDLIRHYCYKKDLDFKNWWPWYFLRPIVGFMFGIVVVLFSGTELLFTSGKNSSETYLIAIAIIAGISVEDVMLKIRKVSLVLFGNNNPDPGSSGNGKSVTNEIKIENPASGEPMPGSKQNNTVDENKSEG